jgi:hypothetical protein
VLVISAVSRRLPLRSYEPALGASGASPFPRVVGRHTLPQEASHRGGWRRHPRACTARERTGERRPVPSPHQGRLRVANAMGAYNTRKYEMNLGGIMTSGETLTRLQDLRDTVKWVGTSVISVGIAISGAAVLTRLGAVPTSNRFVPIILALAALAAIVSAAALSVWALSARDPSLADLLPELQGLTDTLDSGLPTNGVERTNGKKRSRNLARDIAKAAPVAQFKYRTMADLGAELQRRRTEWLDALRAADSPDAIGEAWKDAVPELGGKLESVYADLREVTDAVTLVRTRRRVGIAVPLTVLLGALVVATMVPFVLFTQPETPNKPIAAPVTSAVAVNVRFVVNPAEAKSAEGCIPSRADRAVAAGGTWSRPLLIFTAHKTSQRCLAGSIWTWYPEHEGAVVITPLP